MPEGECGHIRQCTSACVATNMLHFRHSKNLPKLTIWYFHSNVSVMFNQTIDHISFNYGTLLCVCY